MRTGLPEIHQTAPTAGLTGRIRPQNHASLPKRRSSRHLGAAKHVDQMFLESKKAPLWSLTNLNLTVSGSLLDQWRSCPP